MCYANAAFVNLLPGRGSSLRLMTPIICPEQQKKHWDIKKTDQVAVAISTTPGDIGDGSSHDPPPSRPCRLQELLAK